MTMTLHWSPRSPYVRKVMITLHETGLLPEVALQRSVVALHLPPNAAVLADNPLGKIPALVTGDGPALFDSRVICEYLDLRAQAGLFPAEPAARLRQLRWQAMGDGLLEMLLLWRTELLREVGPWQGITSGWQAKVQATMTALETEAQDLAGAPFGIGQIALVCALGQLDFRWNDADWRTHFPQLAGVAAAWQARHSVSATMVQDDQPDAVDVTAGQLRFSAG